MLREFAFHQALFGYDTGHHLLGASLQLPTEVRRLLAVATDLSGSASSEGFDASYTGLPLAGTNYYALFCTWLAPEMPRPGCVWSHVVFIELADFSELLDLGALRHAFHRPTVENLEDYQIPLKLQMECETTAFFPNELKSRAERILAALYLMPDRPIVVPASDSQEFEGLIFSLWSQQWPRLRRGFRFSTGSFADRGRSGVTYDLQVTPESHRRVWQRRGEIMLLDNSGSLDAAMVNKHPWMIAARDDLFSPHLNNFRSFLRTYGADVSNPRSAFARLGLAYEELVLRPNNDWTETLTSIGESFPDESEAILLKESLIKTHDSLEPDYVQASNLATASFLLTSDQAKPYARVPLDFHALAQNLWGKEKSKVLSLLAEVVRQQERPSATAFVTAMANVIQPRELGLIFEERPDLIPLFVSHRPELAFHVEAWRLPTNSQWRVYEVLDALSLDPKDWCEIMAAMFLTATSVAVSDAVKKAGPHAIEGALHWLGSEIAQEYLPSQLWREALAGPAADRLRIDDSLSPPSLALCSWLVFPSVARELLDSSRKDVQALAGQPLEMVPPPLRLHVAFLLVTLGLRSGDANAVKLLARGFFPVYDALASGNYSSESWQLLSPELPHLGAWREWDRCKKLRRAIRDRLPQQSAILAKSLTEAATSPEHLALVRRLC